MKRFYMFAITAAAALSAAALPQESLIKRQAEAVGMKPTLNLRSNKPYKAAPAKAADSAAWGEWEMAGTGTLTLDTGLEDFLGLSDWTGDFPDVNVYSRTDANDVNSVQYKFENVFNNVDMIVDYNAESGFCKVLPQSTGIELYEDCIINVVDMGSAYELFGAKWGGLTEEEAQEVADYYSQFNYFVPDLGRFYLYLGYYIADVDDLIALTDTTFQLDGMDDMSVSVEVQSFYKDASEMKGLVKFSSAVTLCRYGCFSGILTQDMINSVLEGEDGIEELTETSDIGLINSEGNGIYTVVAVTYSSDGTPLEWNYAEYTFTSSSREGWSSLGKGSYTSDIFECLFGEEPVTYEVEVERNDLDPALIRIVNPYGASSPYYEDEYVDCAKDYDIYLVFDTSNPNRVYFKPTNLGIDYGGGWWIGVSTGYYMGDIAGSSTTPSQFGSLKDDVLSFPERSVLVTCAHIDEFGGQAGMWYYGNASGSMSLTLPVATAVEGINVDKTAPSCYFNMQGMPVSAPAKGSMVIERKGSSVSKRVIR